MVILVLTLGTWAWMSVTHDQYSQLDRRLDSLSNLGDVSTLLSNTEQARCRQVAARQRQARARPSAVSRCRYPGVVLPA